MLSKKILKEFLLSNKLSIRKFVIQPIVRPSTKIYCPIFFSTENCYPINVRDKKIAIQQIFYMKIYNTTQDLYEKLFWKNFYPINSIKKNCYPTYFRYKNVLPNIFSTWNIFIQQIFYIICIQQIFYMKIDYLNQFYTRKFII